MIGDNLNFCYADENYSIHRLSDYLGIDEAQPDVNVQEKPGFIVKTDMGNKAIFVDEVLNCRDIVLKKFGSYLPHLKGVHGAASLGDGQIIAVLEINDLLRSGNSIQKFKSTEKLLITDNIATATKVLIVEDSLSTRRMLEQLVSDAGYEVKTAIDGIEAVQSLKKWIPDIILSDLELPRLNGLELTSHIRAREELAHIPLIMITSRYTEKHKEHAKKVGVTHYLTKPFSENDVISHIEKSTRVSA